MGRSTVNDRFRIGLTIFFGTVSILAGGGFLYKLYEFFMSIDDKNIIGFAIAPLVNYVLVAGGFLALLVWAFLSGQFSDIEKPKIDLLIDQEKYDREDPHLHPELGSQGSEPKMQGGTA
ncbi:MAG: cbb3-type cytochrome oxidase assembly protein CcoS [Planctomycetota bacterium]|nr:MAG: cbb3-type cytochrome oxidase assembly protein CcoS [Planctomycetota bacterium]